MTHHLLSSIAYFDVFSYPVSSTELKKLHPNIDNIDQLLAELKQRGLVCELNGFYGIEENIKENVSRRLRGNNTAIKYQPKSRKYSKLISKFPYVQGVFISGSFSKGYISDDGDIDYFIVTKPGRLWVSRSLLILYKKLFLFNSHELFCVNYFIDHNSLEINEKNIFTAMEIATMKPMINQELFDRFLNENTWHRDYFSGSFHGNFSADKLNSSNLKKFGEFAFNGVIGDKIEKLLLKVTLKRWQKKFNYLNSSDFEVAMKSTTNVSKHHPNNFQRKVLERHNEILTPLLEKINLTDRVEATV